MSRVGAGGDDGRQQVLEHSQSMVEDTEICQRFILLSNGTRKGRRAANRTERVTKGANVRESGFSPHRRFSGAGASAGRERIVIVI